MRLGPPAIRAALLVAGAVALAGCQSTQSLSDELEKKGAKLAKVEHIQIGRESSQVDVVGTTVLSDQNGGAVVVELKNTTAQSLVNVPIQIDVRDAKGRTVYQNNIEGLEPELIEVPLIPSGATISWVHDQVLATGTPKSVKTEVGQSSQTTNDIPDLDVSPPKLRTDPVSGIEATGTVLNNTDEDVHDLFLFAVARKGDQIVAAGRGAIRRIKANAEKEANYHIFFIGDPRGAQVAVTPQPTQKK